MTRPSGVASTSVRAALLFFTATGAVSVVAPAMGAQTSPAARAARPLSLEDALGLAGQTSEILGIARAGYVRAQGQQYQARSAMLPQVNTSLGYQRQLQNQFQAISERFGTGGPPDNGNGEGGGGGDDLAENPITRIFASPYNVTFTLQASQSLFSGGRNLAQVRSARALRESAGLGITAADAQVQLEVTEAYFDAVLADRLVAIAESTLVQAERTQRQVQLTFDVGNTSEFELIRATVTRDNQRPQYLQSRSTRDLAMLRLKTLLDVPLDEALELTTPIQESDPRAVPVARGTVTLAVNVDEVVAADPRVAIATAAALSNADTLISARLPVRQADLAADAAAQQLKATRAQRWPQLSANTNYQRFAYPDDGLPNSIADFFPNWTVGLNVSVPLFTGGRIKGDILNAEAAVQEARMRARQAREAAALEARTFITQFEQAQSEWLASIGTADQAQRGYDIAEVRYNEGISTQVELSETRVQLQQALANRARSARDLQVARMRLALLRDLPLGAGAGLNGAGGMAPQQQMPSAQQRQQQSAAQGGAFTQPGAPGGGNTP